MSGEGESDSMEVTISSDENEDIKMEEIEEDFVEKENAKIDDSAVEMHESSISTEKEMEKDTLVESSLDTTKSTCDTEENSSSSSNSSNMITANDKPNTCDKIEEQADENIKIKVKETQDIDGENKSVKEVAFDHNEPITGEVSLVQSQKKNQGVSNIPVSKDASTFRMHLTKEEIDKMINDGTLEKVSEGHYRVRPESVKNLKSTPLAQAKELNLDDKSDNSTLESDTVITTKPETNAILGNSVVAPVPSAQVSGLPIVQQASLIALMPVNQVPTNSNNNNAFIALPVQQNSTTVAYTTTLPAFVAISQSASSAHTTTVSSSTIPTVSTGIKIISSSSKPKGKSTESSALTPILPRLDKSSTSDESLKSQSVSDDVSIKSSNKPASSTMKRKPIFYETEVKRPYKYAKLADKPKKKSALRNIVNDTNTSDEEEDGGLAKCKTYGAELASMFFKKVGEPKTANRSLLDKIHKAIFNDPDSQSDQESEGDSEIEEVIEKVKTGKSEHYIVNCPGPKKYEAFIGPANNSKLSIVRCQEIRHTKNASYELYRVRVTSAGREANTNILIPIPEGYKLNFPTKPREESVEFSHTPHQDYESMNNASPLLLEKLTKTELKLRKYKDQIKVLRGRYIELLQEYSNRPQFSTVSDLVGSAAKFLTEDQLVFFLMQLKAGAHNMQGIRYSVREKILALAIFQKSPEVYKWLSKLFNLPSKRILDQWLEEVGSQDPKLLKQLMYHIYISYNFKADK